MSPFRLAHFSDIHVTVPPLEAPWSGLAGKRLAGFTNYYVGGRRRAFTDVEVRIARLLDDLDAMQIDHAVCTGDLTSMSYGIEFERCAALFDGRLHEPERFTVLPGNHDRYTRSATSAREFERWFGELASPNDAWPFRKDVSPQVTVIGVDVCRPTGLLDSSGWCGPEQRSRLADLLAAPDLRDRFVVVALHYALFLADGRRDRATHGIRDDRELVAVLEGPRSRVDLVVHGHVHEPYVLERERFAIACAGSATDLRRSGGYQIFEIGASGVTMERRVWDASAGRYRADGARAIGGPRE